jgi:Big-like domain-containing protein
MRRTSAAISLALGLALLAVGCGGENDGSMMSASPGTGMPGAIFIAVTPQGGATGVSPSAPIVFRFGAVMGAGMEQYVDLHMGDLAGPTVPMGCGWSGDRTTLTCTPQGPLSSRTNYVVHLGGGMMTQAGQHLDYGLYGPMLGGQWIMRGMMGRSHSGGAWGMMGPSWRHANGSYGMAFSFTTA